MTKWKLWRRAFKGRDEDGQQFKALMAYLNTRHDAQSPRAPIHMRLYMRWKFRTLTQARPMKACEREAQP